MSEISYKVGELRQVIRESSQSEFKPKLGPHVERDDKKNAQEAYEKAEERAKNYDGGLKTPEKRELNPRMSGNKTMLGLDYDDEPSDAFKKRVKAQAEGYTSELEKNNGIEKSGDFNDDFYENEKETVNMMADDKDNIRTSGLVSSKLGEKDSEYGKSHTAFPGVNENRKPIKRLTYHHTKFVNESQIFAKIPEEFKVDGNKFIVRDATDSEYLIEWCIDKKNNISEGRIINERNLNEADKTLDRMAELMGYKSANVFGRQASKSVINEDTNVGDMLNKIRNITD
jgi:hypothetical protein